MAMLYRSYFAMTKMPLTNPSGLNVSALFGFINTLLALIEKELPDYLAVCTDSAEPTFRHQLFSDYKATRDVMPDDLQLQINPLYDLLKAMNITLLQKSGFEADDIIATITQTLKVMDYEIVIVSGDKDLAQLIESNIRILSPDRRSAGMWNETTRDKVIEKYGITPEQLGDWLAMVGDTSDNIPGIPKIGPKAATELLQKFNSLENIIQQVETIDKKVWQESILANFEQAKLSRKLVELNSEVPLEVIPEEFNFGPFIGDELRDQLNTLGFRSLLNRILSNTEKKVEEVRDYRLVQTIEDLEEVIRQINQSPVTALDTETTNVDPNLATLVAISLSTREQQGWCIHLPTFQCSLDSKNYSLPKEEDFFRPLFSEESKDIINKGSHSFPSQQFVLDKLKRWLEDDSKKKCGQNLKYDQIVLERAGVNVQGWIADTMLMSYLMDPISRSHSMDVLAQKYLMLPKISTESILTSGKIQRTMDSVPVDLLVNYACEDADYTKRLYQILSPILEKEQLMGLHNDVELPLSLVLAKMERTGIKIDKEVLRKLSNEFSQEQNQVEQEVFSLVGHSFNLSSPLQLSKVLFDELKLKPVKKTKTGYSTNEDVLLKLIEQDPTLPVPKLILKYRMYAKLLNTYIDALPKLINPNTGRVHTSFNQSVTSTGRLSSTDPNLQNIPIRSEEGAKIRTAFTAGYPNWKMISADYSQIELRLMAHFSQDATLVSAFKEGKDIHAITASKVFNVPLEDVTPSMRRSAKAVNFGIVYGQTDYGLSTSLDIPMSEAQTFRSQYFQTYPGVQEYMQKTIEFARTNKFVQTLFGRKRVIPDITSDQRVAREFAERIAINTPIQGSAADIIKIAMVRLHNSLEFERKQNGLQAQLLLQVHDELVLEAPENEIEFLKNLIKQSMEQVIELSIPITVDIGIGNNWLEAH